MDISKFTISQTAKNKPITSTNNSSNSVGGSVLGYFTATVLSSEIQSPIRKFINKTQLGLNKGLNKDEITLLNSEVDKLFKESELAKKGTTFFKLNKDNQNVVAETKALIKESIRKPAKNIVNATGKKNSEKIYNFFAKIFAKSIIERKNSFFFPNKNVVLVNEKNYGLNVFGTLGHAINKKTNIMYKAVEKMSFLKYLFGPILLISVISKNKTAQNGETLSNKDKFTNFVRNNAGKLGMLVMVPFIAKEGITAFKAHRLISNTTLTQNIKSSAKAINAWKPLKPIIHALISGFSLFCAVETKDYFQNRKNNKTAQPV